MSDVRSTPPDQSPDNQQSTGLSRRTVVRTAAHSAWVAPVIVAASAAPAFAASGPAAVTTSVTGSRTDGTLTITVTLTNANTGPAGATTLVVTATPAPVTGSTIQSSDPAITNAEGWVFTTRSGNSGGRTYNFTNPNVPGAATPTGTATSTLVFTVPVSDGLVAPSSGTITAVPTVASGASTGGAGAWT